MRPTSRRVAVDLTAAAAAATTTPSLSPLLLSRRTTAFPLLSKWVVPRACSARAAFPVQERTFGSSTREAAIMEASSRRAAARRSKRPIKLSEEDDEDEEVEEEVPLEEDDEEDEDYEDSKKNEKTSTTTRTHSRPPPPQQPRKKKQRKLATRREKREPPPHWEDVLEGITEMRKERVAPVDTMGCAALADPLAEPKVQRFQTLVSLMLSSQTKDEQTAAAMAKLKDKSHGGLTPENILNMPESKLDSLIRNVGFHARKTIYLKKTAAILVSDYDGDIPPEYEGLLALPGVGPKMAHLCMQIAWKRTEGIGVDVHVHRISNRLGWVKTNTPEATREELEQWLPREHWASINALLVGFGQTVCLPRGPKCEGCKVLEWCPTGRKNVKRK